MIYLYDGSWNGMMTLVHRTAQDEVFPEDILRTSPGRTEKVLLESTTVPSDADVAEATAAVLERRVGAPRLSDACLALMSEEEGIDLAVWRCLSRLWREGRQASGDLADACVGAVLRAARRSFREWHRWMGLVRFRDTGGTYYAPFEPECDVLPLLADHFRERLPDRWVLHDVRRRQAALHDGGRWVLTEAAFSSRNLKLTGEEALCQTLWQEFFRSTAVRERRSEKRQRQFLPKRTWTHLIERPGAETQQSGTP